MAENAIRPFVIGRKTWLFSVTRLKVPRQVLRATRLVETAKLNALEPFSYLRTLLNKLPYAETVEQIKTLLPWNIEMQRSPKKLVISI